VATPNPLENYYCVPGAVLRMKIQRLLIGEGILLFASVLVFRSVWTLLDRCFGYNYLLEMLLVGAALTTVGLVLLNEEVECELKEMRK
jgi:hypothetical protein